MRLRPRLLIVLSLLATGLPLVAEAGQSAERAFTVGSRPGLYGVSAQTHQLTVSAADGTKLFVEVWTPVAKGKAVPPTRVPIVVDVTPYAFKGLPRPDRINAVPRWKQIFVSHGYALANVHLRGSGESGGCWGNHGSQDADDASRAIAALTKAPFSDGRLALFGKSHDGGAALNVSSRGEASRIKGVKAVIVLAPVDSYYNEIARDGVVTPSKAAQMTAVDLDSASFGRTMGTYNTELRPEEYVQYGTKDPKKIADRLPCRVTEARELHASQGEMTPYLADRELALSTDRIKAPVLMTYGYQDPQVWMIPGVFDTIRSHKAGLFFNGGHDYPDQNSVRSAFSRFDWEAMVIAWLDRWVLGTDNGADHWPTAQVQGPDGQWRAETGGFPRTGGPNGFLALGSGGVLGARRPSGASELTDNDANDLGSHRIFRTAPLSAPLEIVGQPVADLWLDLHRTGTEVTAYLRVIGPDGRVLSSISSSRSTSFLKPLLKDRFVQTAAVAPALGVPVNVPVRFDVGDIVVPGGGRVELDLGSGLTSAPNVNPMIDSNYSIVHDCTHLSALRFLMPQAHPDLLNVKDELPARTVFETASGLRSGGGLAVQKVC